MNIEERFWILVSRKLAHEADEAERMELEKILNDHPVYKKKYDAHVSYWNANHKLKNTAVEHALQRTWDKIEDGSGKEISIERHHFPAMKYMLRLCAALIIGFSFYFLFISLDQNKNMLSSFIWTKEENTNGIRSKITLSDGSVVWLNADSELRYPETFGKTREVFLEGEAFFDIRKNPEKPFVIHLDQGKIRVLGTSFNVRAFQDDKLILTSVLTGKVAFIPQKNIFAQPTDTVLLTPNYKAVYDKAAGTLSTEKTNGTEDRSWIDGILNFRSERFSDIGKALERTFGKNVVFENEKLQACRLTGQFQNNSLEEIMMLLSKTGNYQYTITDKEVRISGEGCAPAQPLDQ